MGSPISGSKLKSTLRLALHCMDTGHTYNCQDNRDHRSAYSQRARRAIEALQSIHTTKAMLQVIAFTALIGIL